MTERLYDCLEITDLKDMLNKTKKIYGEKPAYKIKTEDGKYKVFTHREIRDMVDYLGTALINLRLKGKRIAIIGQNRYEWEIAYLAVVCGTGIVVPLDKSLPENELEAIIQRSEIEAIFYSSKYEETLKKIKYSEKNRLKHLISTDLKVHNQEIYSQEELVKRGKKLIEEGHREFLDAIEKSTNWFFRTKYLHKNVTTTQVGNVATFLLSDMSDCITGQVIYADNGYNIMGV